MNIYLQDFPFFADIENNLTRILKLIKNEDQSKRDENSRKETELEGLIEDFYNQYQSLYALYGRLTGEYVKVVPRGAERRVSSVSSSSSDSEYFSSEEVSDTAKQELDTENSNLNQKLFSKERERSYLANTHEVVKTQASTEAKEAEERLNPQMKEVERLNQQKRNPELQVESQAHEVKQLSAKNTELQDRVLELELLLKETKGVVSVLQATLKSNEDKAMSKNAELVAQINKLEQEAKSLRNQKGKMEEKIKRTRNEALSQKKDFKDQLNVMQRKLDSVCHQNKELEAQLEKEREQVSQCLVQIENLKENLAETTSVEQSLLKEKECFLSRINDLELGMESRCSNQNDLEEQLRNASCEINWLADERKALQDTNHELERAMTQKEEEISALMREHESNKNGASTQAMALTTEVECMRLELDPLQEQKNMLELQNERSQKEYPESLAKMENLNVKLETKVVDQEETIKKLTETIDQIRAENKQTKIWSKKDQRFTERKMEELAEEFRKRMEDNIRLLHQRIHITEQLNIENKDSYKKTKERYEQENKMLEEKIACYEDELRTLKVRGLHSPSPVVSDLNELDLAAGKLEEHVDYVLNLVSKMLCEVQFAKELIKKRNGEMKQLKEQESLLREKVWELEANVSREGGEKLNLMKAVSQLEKKVVKLEKNLKERDEELVSLGEKKREAIRQLCFLVEFHRERCDYLKDFITKARVSNRK